MSLALSRLPRFAERSQLFVYSGFIAAIAAFVWHAMSVWSGLRAADGLSLTLATTGSFVGLQLAAIAMLAALSPSLRGLCAGLFGLSALSALFGGFGAGTATAAAAMSWQLQVHVLVSLFAYGLLTVGAIVGLYGLIQDRRLRSGQLSALNLLFAPLETTERLLFGITAAGFSILAIGVFSGLAFVDNLFAQHLVHKTVLSLLALVLFGILLAGRQFAGWRGRQAIYLYLGGFGILCLAYYGSRFVLENVLGRSWG